MSGKIAVRYVLAIMGSVGLGLVYGLKVNLHVAIVGMVNHTAVSGTEHGEASEDGPFIWSKIVQGLLLSSYFWGYMVAQLPGGRIAEIFSAKWVMFFSVAINTFGAILTPCMAMIHYTTLLVIRVAQGIGGGVSMPGMHVMLARWAPPGERSIMCTIVYTGTALGTVVFMLVSGLIAAAIGWKYVFYIEGGVSAIWLVLWMLLVSDSPAEHKFISSDEREYIMTSLDQGEESHSKKDKRNVPWKAVMTSSAFWAILISHLCSSWGWYAILIELPLYMKTILKFKLNDNAFLTSLPFLCMGIFSMTFGKVLDVLRGKQIITTTTARKLATGCASIPPLLCFIALCYVDSKIAGVTLMTIATTGLGGNFCGFLSNHIDIAPNFAGTLMAITNTVATIPGIVVPIFVGKLLKHDDSIKSWRIVFWVTVGLFSIQFVVFTTFGSGEEQPWSKLTPIEEQNL